MAIVIPYVKQTWTDGSGGGTPISAARLGVLEEGILDVSQSPAVSVTHNANQSITSGVTTALAFNTERFDQAGGVASTMHDTVTNNSRLTAVYAGVYLVFANIAWAAAASGERDLNLRINGATVIANRSDLGSASLAQFQNVSRIYSFAVSDYVEAVVFQNSGGALNVTTNNNYSPEFGMVRVG